MFVETLACRVRLVEPRSFAGLMALYESNYQRLRQLCGNLRWLAPRAVSTSRGDLALHLTVLEHSRYTTSLHMTYRITDGDGVDVNPDLVLRVYHDARLAETLRCCDAPQPAALRAWLRPAATELGRRWALNLFLNKWLEYCLDHRHRFVPLEV